jgi:uroporphyrinogen-III decarboxylase
MTSRERMLCALANQRPDRLPCQVHGWMDYYLAHYLGGMDWWQAYEKFGLDYAIYVSPDYTYATKDLANWRVERRDLGINDRGDHAWVETITTPKGTLHRAGAYNEITPWETEPLIKTEHDFELWDTFLPVPARADLTVLHQTRERLGDRGIVRSHPYSFGQGSPWQSLCILMGTEPAIITAMSEPERVHHMLEAMLSKTLRTLELWAGTPADMVEIGGGAGSSTVISPGLFEQFCLPYDQRQIARLHALGLKVVYHLCGGLMPMLDLVVQTNADGLETMTPPAMGGDCDLREASRRVGNKLFFIGGFDQNQGFENGTPEVARKQVLECFAATRDHAGYICCPSDHFFHGNPENIQAFADAARECVY